MTTETRKPGFTLGSFQEGDFREKDGQERDEKMRLDVGWCDLLDIWDGLGHRKRELVLQAHCYHHQTGDTK